MIWTTTPWTLPANVAAAVKPDAEYGRRENGEWVAVSRYPDETFVERLPGARPGRLALRRARSTARARGGRRAPGDPVGRGHARRGHRDRPYRAGLRRRGLRALRVHDLAVLTPVDETGRFYADYGWLHGTSTGEAADQIVGDLGERGLLVTAGTYEHRYPHCWRCDTPLIFRISDDWFISVAELRQPLLDANADVEWTPAYMGKRMDDWLRNMGDWNISRRRYYGLPLPFYPCACGHLNVIGSRAELEERATRRARSAGGAPPAVDRRGADPLRGVRRRGDAHPRGGRRLARRRHRARSRRSAGRARTFVAERLRHRRREGADDCRSARSRVLGAVVPRRLGDGDARADPALVLLAAPDVGRPRRAGAVPEGARLREDARRDGPRDAQLVGQHDRAPRMRSRAWAPT